MIKNPPAIWETGIQSLGWEDPLEKRMATYSCILAWRSPWTEESGGLQSMGLQNVRQHWATNIFTFTRTYHTVKLHFIVLVNTGFLLLFFIWLPSSMHTQFHISCPYLIFNSVDENFTLKSVIRIIPLFTLSECWEVHGQMCPCISLTQGQPIDHNTSVVGASICAQVLRPA